MRDWFLSLPALVLMHAAVVAADGVGGAAECIRSDADLRHIMADTGFAAVDAERLDRFAERIDLNLDRIRARVGTLPLAAEQELRHAEQDLNTLKTRAPYNPEIPLLERDLSRVRRLAR